MAAGVQAAAAAEQVALSQAEIKAAGKVRDRWHLEPWLAMVTVAVTQAADAAEAGRAAAVAAAEAATGAAEKAVTERVAAVVAADGEAGARAALMAAAAEAAASRLSSDAAATKVSGSAQTLPAPPLCSLTVARHHITYCCLTVARLTQAEAAAGAAIGRAEVAMTRAAAAELAVAGAHSLSDLVRQH